MNELTILFFHHANDSVTRHHFQILQKLNPGTPIVTLVHRSNDGLLGSLDAAKLEPSFVMEHWWRGVDIMLYAWYRHARCSSTSAHRYALIEWDMLWRDPLKEFYHEVWNADLAGKDPKENPGIDPEWPWWNEISRFPVDLQPFASGMAPFAGCLIADRVLAAICAHPIPLGVFSELRLATLTQAQHFNLTALNPKKCTNLSYTPHLVQLDVATPVYHPVKALVERPTSSVLS
jgi:hypothetical protein